MSMKHNIILNNELQFKDNVSEVTARALKDKLMKEDNKEVSLVRFSDKVRFVLTFRNPSFYKNLYVEED